MRKSVCRSAFLTSYPRYLLETIAISVIFLTLILMKRSGTPIVALIPIIGVFALGYQKLLPSVQQIYTCWASISLSKKSGLNIIELLLNSQAAKTLFLESSFTPNLHFHTISFDKASFCYNKKTPVLREVSLDIRRGEKIGIIGETGSGKSTFIDLLMGLLEPDSGSIQIDGRNLHSCSELLHNWQLSISHVPQNIYLSDKSILENIAFSVKPESINKPLAVNAAKLANIYQHIQSLPNQFLTPIGEHGIKLSGGQRQRLGIARAVYKSCPILILDEATSALDEATEEIIINNINQISPPPTVLIIAHRLSTLKYCDRIIEFKSGKIKAVHPRGSKFFLDKIQSL
jgi:ATP-binding cassette subfamily B protein